MTEVVYVNSFNKVSVFGFEPQVDMFIYRPRHLHLQHIGTCVKMEHHKYWDSPLIYLVFVVALQYLDRRLRWVDGKDLNAGT